MTNANRKGLLTRKPSLVTLDGCDLSFTLHSPKKSVVNGRFFNPAEVGDFKGIQPLPEQCMRPVGERPRSLGEIADRIIERLRRGHQSQPD